MAGRRLYDFLYKRGAPLEGGPREELVHLVESGRFRPGTGSRAIDLGCGSGANVVFLAEHGFDATGVDFSRVALAKARVTDRARFIEVDLTRPSFPDVEGLFDLVVDYGTLDDFKGAKRLAVARPPRASHAPAASSSYGASTLRARRSPSSASMARRSCPERSRPAKRRLSSARISISSGCPALPSMRLSRAS